MAFIQNFQSAIFNLLSQDAALMGLVTGVYRRPVSTAAVYPYIIYDAPLTPGVTRYVLGNRWPVEESPLVQVSAYGTTAQGRAIMDQIIDRVHTICSSAEMSITGWQPFWLRTEMGPLFVIMEDRFGNELLSYNARYRALLLK